MNLKNNHPRWAITYFRLFLMLIITGSMLNVVPVHAAEDGETNNSYGPVAFTINGAAPGAGVYDDSDSGWTYDGAWTALTGLVGPYSDTIHRSQTTGDAASFSFNGTQFILKYTRSTDNGDLDVYVDDVKIDTLDTSGDAQFQSVYVSPFFTSGEHIVRFENAGGGIYVNIDSIEVVTTSIPGVGVYDDGDTGWAYGGVWTALTGLTGPYSDTMHRSQDTGDGAFFAFNGTRFILKYTQDTSNGSLDIYVDGNKITTLDTSGALEYQKTYTSPLFPSEDHYIRFENVGDGTYVNIDSIEVLDTAVPGVGVYDDADSLWTYDGTWTAFTGLTGPYSGTMHRSQTIGDRALFTFNGTQFILKYTQDTGNGDLDVYVDGNKIATIDTSGSQQFQTTYSSPVLTLGDHFVSFENAGGGTYVNIDSIEILDTSALDLPDLVITGVTLTDLSMNPISEVNTGEEFLVNIEVTNQGGNDYEDWITRNVYLGPASLVGGCHSGDDSYFDIETTLIPSGESSTQSVSVTINSAGTYNLYVYVDVTCSVDETNEDNNDYEPITVNVGTQVDVKIGSTSEGPYFLQRGQEKRLTYPLSGGPVTVESSDGTNIVSAIRLQSVESTTNNTLRSFVETMGIPSSMVSYKYYFPSYTGTFAPLNSQIRFSNLDDITTRIRVTIGNEIVWEQDVPGVTQPQLGSPERRLNFLISGGPVIVESLDPNKKIVSTIRLQVANNGALYSFAETVGIPVEALSYSYSFSSYTNTFAPLNSQIRFSNLDATTTRIRVTIGDTIWWEDNVPGYNEPQLGSSERRLSFPVSGGPVVVESLDTSKKIISAIRLQAFDPNTSTLHSFIETMGVPKEILSYKYYFPSYNNLFTPLNSQIRFSNLEATTTRIRITIGPDIVWEDNVPGLAEPNLGLPERRLTFNVSGGPVIVESLDPSRKIVAAIRLQVANNGALYSFSETVGVPFEKLSSAYYFPSYTGTFAPLNSQLRFGVP